MAANNGLYKRLMREMQDLKNYKDIKQLQLVFPFDGDPLPKNVSTYYVSKDVPYLRVKIDNNELIIAFKSEYPFKPPVLLINNVDFHRCYKIDQKLLYSEAALAELHRKHKMYCLCCETSMCNGSGKWSSEYSHQSYFRRIQTIQGNKALFECLSYIISTECTIRSYVTYRND